MAEAQTGKGADKASAKGGDKAAEKAARAKGKGKGGDSEVKLASAADLVSSSRSLARRDGQSSVERALFPDVPVAHQHDSDVHKHLREPEQPLAHAL